MTDHLSLTFAALADPTRRAMLQRLAEGQANIGDLGEPFLGQMSRPAITKHVKVLERAGLIKKSQDAQRRPCELNPSALKEASDWMQQYREHWEESLDRLDEYLKSVTAKAGSKTKPKRGKKRGRK